MTDYRGLSQFEKDIPSADCAIGGVTWYEATRYCNWLSRSEGLPESQWYYPEEIGQGMKLPADYLERTGYRLPTEAEWEYACRAGSRTRYSWGEEIAPDRALYRWPGAAHAKASPPGQFAANAFGLYDMHGNVREWTQDSWRESYDLTPQDGRPASEGHSSMRVTRGSHWLSGN